MIHFDSIKDKSWTGRGLKIDEKSLTLLKSVNLEHRIHLVSGKYNLKIIGKKRSGNGSVNMKISSENNIALNAKITFSTSTWSEYTYAFDISKGGSFNLILTRGGSSFGSIEIGRLIVSGASELNSIPKKKKESGLPIRKIEESTFLLNKKTNSNRKLAFIVPYGIYGGGEIYIQEIINKLGNRPIDITILYMQENKIKFKINNSVNHSKIKTGSHLIGLIKSEEFDYVVYYNSRSVYDLLMGAKESGDIGCKLIEIYHSDFEWSDSISRLKERKHVSHMISVADCLAKDIMGISDENRTTIPVGIDTKRFSKKFRPKIRESLKLSENSRIIGTVSRLSKEKNIEYILKLAKIMSDDVFIIVGDGPEMKNLSNMKTKNVMFVGFQNNVEDYYNIFDAFIMSSNMEGTPISMLEAMASEVPIYTSNVGAISDIIKDGYNGKFLSMEPEKDASLISNAYNSNNMKKDGRKYIELYHNIDENSETFYKSILKLDDFFSKTDLRSFDDIELIGEFI